MTVSVVHREGLHWGQRRRGTPLPSEPNPAAPTARTAKSKRGVEWA